MRRIRSTLSAYAAPITLSVLASLVVAILFLATWDLLFPDQGHETAKAVVVTGVLTPLLSIVGTSLHHAYKAERLRREQAFKITMAFRDRLDRYVPAYLAPLAAVCGDLGATLRTIGDVIAQVEPTQELISFLAEREVEAFYDICRYTVLFDSVRSRSNPLRSSELVPGIVLSSHEREDQVWKLLPQPWGLGVTGSLQGALARHAVTDQNEGWRTFDSFVSRVDQEPELGELSSAVGTRVREIANDAPTVFLALSRVLNAEIGDLYEGWYGETRDTPTEDLDAVRQLSVASRIELGVGYGVTDTDREHYGRTGDA